MTRTEAHADPAKQGDEILVVAIGEVLWDVFPSGPRFGGAPANFACAMAGLAPDFTVEMVSAVGDDDLGRDAIASLQQQGVGTRAVTQNKQVTGQVHVSLDDQGVASYEFAEDCAWDNLLWSERLNTLANQSDVVCFGTLGQRSDASKSTIQQFVRSSSSDCLRVFDINLRPPYYSEAVIRESLEIANVLKLNDDELPLLASLLNIEGNPRELLAQIAEIVGLDLIALTRGEKGAMIFKYGEISDSPGVPASVVDTVGAGDAFTAAMIVGLLEGHDIATINHKACEVAAFVCSQPGATPSMPPRFRSH